MYYSDPEDIEDLGWDRFMSGAWEAIFLGYRSTAGIRTIARRWSDLLQAGVGCSPEIADLLVRDQVMVRQDRDLIAIRDPVELISAMDQVLGDIGTDLADLPELRAADRPALLAAYGRLWEYLRDNFLAGED